MYEQAFRLSQYGTIEALEKQVKCYLASVNTFSLCDPKFTWVLKPVDPDIPEEIIEMPSEAGSEQVIISFKYMNVLTPASYYRNLRLYTSRNNWKLSI